MSAEEDTELRDLVAETLERNGVLNKIRAELRANVFLALEEQNTYTQKKTISNKTLKSFLETNEGQQVFSLVREFLEFFHLDFTLAVLDPECDFVGKALSRENICSALNICPNSGSPLLAEILKRKVGSKTPDYVKHNDPKDTKSYILEDDDDLDDADDLLKDLGVLPASFNPLNANNRKNKSNLDTSPKSKWKKNEAKTEQKLANGLKNVLKHGENKDDKMLDITSPEWDDLLKIDQKISNLGFEVTRDTKSMNYKRLNLKESDYEDDFQATSSQKSDGLSISEELDDDLSIGSFAGSKADDILTTDQTVSQLSGVGFDYGEDAEKL